MTHLLLALLSQKDTPNLFNLNDGEYILRNATQKSLSLDRQSNTISFEATGNPAELLGGPTGATLSGKNAGAVIEKLNDGTYRILSADLTGAARVIVDSKAGAAFLKARGKPADETVESRTELSSDALSLRTQDKFQTVTSQTPLNLVDDRRKFLPSLNVQHSVLSGSKGFVTFILGPGDPIRQVQSGEIEGPVHYHVKQSEFKPNARPTITEYDIKADRLVLDFTKPQGTVTATGHVHWSESGSIPFTSDDDEAVLHMDANGEVQSITGSGHPTRTVVPLPKSGSGR